MANTVCSRLPEPQITDVESSTNGEIQQLILDYLNETLFEIYATSIQWRWREVEDTFNLVNGQLDYDLATAVATPIQPDTIKVVRNGVDALTYIDKSIADKNIEFYMNNSKYYTIFNNTFRLFSMPVDSGTITITYQSPPSLLIENEDVPLIPEEYHYVIVKGAEWRVKQHQGRPEAPVIKGEYDDWLRKMLRFNKQYYQSKHRIRLGSQYSNKDWAV